VDTRRTAAEHRHDSSSKDGRPVAVSVGQLVPVTIELYPGTIAASHKIPARQLSTRHLPPVIRQDLVPARNSLHFDSAPRIASDAVASPKTNAPVPTGPVVRAVLLSPPGPHARHVRHRRCDLPRDWPPELPPQRAPRAPRHRGRSQRQARLPRVRPIRSGVAEGRRAAFEHTHEDRVLGTLVMFDRMI
jgi:hypothetical protein